MKVHDLPLTTPDICRIFRNREFLAAVSNDFTFHSGRSLGVCAWQIHGLGLPPQVPRILEFPLGLKTIQNYRQNEPRVPTIICSSTVCAKTRHRGGWT